MMDVFNKFILSLSSVMSGPTTINVDVVLLILLGVAALTQWLSIGVSGGGAFHWRWIVAAGWSLWFTRFFWSLLANDVPVVPPISVVAIILIALGAIARNLYDSRCVQCSNRSIKGIFSRAEDTKVK